VSKPLSGLARALRSKIGQRCWFRHPDQDHKIIEGNYRRGRKVAVTTGMTRLPASEGRGFNIEETVYTVPAHVPIHFGPPPREVTK
jgi:hypothetical protein